MSEKREIPKAFYSFETKHLFTNCIECDKYLLNDRVEYMIEIAIRKYQGYSARDVVFDYAICLDCVKNIQKEISADSMARIMNYFHENVSDLPSMEKCMIKGTEIDDCEEYQIYAHCSGDKLKDGENPYMISGAVFEELLPLLSKKTRDEMDGFMNRHFSPDPSLMQPTPPMILI